MTTMEWIAAGELVAVLVMLCGYIGAKRDARSARRLARDVLLIAAASSEPDAERRARFEVGCG